MTKLQKKEWTKPELLNLSVVETQGGGNQFTEHDGVKYMVGNTAVEEYRS